MANLVAIDKLGQFERSIELFEKMTEFWSQYGTGLEDFAKVLRQYASLLDNEEKRDRILTKVGMLQMLCHSLFQR
jgi:hypothetical protein